MLTVGVADQPRADYQGRNQVEDLGSGFVRVAVYFGFAEHMDVPRRLRQLAIEPRVEPDDVVWFESRESIQASRKKGPRMARWRVAMFSYLARNATTATAYYHIPSEQLIDIRPSVEI